MKLRPPVEWFAPTIAPDFQRTRHLLFALLALLHGPLIMKMWEWMPVLVPRYPWTAQTETIETLVPLCFVAVLAWLAFAQFDTGSSVTVIPRRWSDVGLVVVAAFVLDVVNGAVFRSRLPPEQIYELGMSRTGHFTDIAGELMIGWLVFEVLAAAAAEELVYRAFLQRALEGFTSPWIALVVQALVFELVHVFVYGYGFKGGGWFVAGLIYGYAFKRTRSLAVPALLHAAGNLIYYLDLWLRTH